MAAVYTVSDDISWLRSRNNRDEDVTVDEEAEGLNVSYTTGE